MSVRKKMIIAKMVIILFLIFLYAFILPSSKFEAKNDEETKGVGATSDIEESQENIPAVTEDFPHENAENGGSQPVAQEGHAATDAVKVEGKGIYKVHDKQLPDKIDTIYVNQEPMSYTLYEGTNAEDILASGENLILDKDTQEYYIMGTLEVPCGDARFKARKVIGEYIIALKKMYWCEIDGELKYHAYWVINNDNTYDLYTEYSPDKKAVVKYKVLKDRSLFPIKWKPYVCYGKNPDFYDCVYILLEDFCKLLNFDYYIDANSRSIYFTSKQ